MKTNLTKTTSISSVTELMNKVEAEIAAVKTGELPESQARVIVRYREVQMNGFQTALRAARLDASLRTDLASRIGKLPSPKVVELKKKKPA